MRSAASDRPPTTASSTTSSCPRPFTPEDLVAIEKKMAHIVKQNRPIEKRLIPKAEALELFARKGQTLKCELIHEKAGDAGPVLHDGRVHRLLPGAAPSLHREDQGVQAQAESPRQSYWKGKEGNPEMQRIYGYAFFTKDELDAHLQQLEEAKRRDHRQLGRELDLFSVSDETGAGLILWHPKGGFIRKQIEDYWRDEHHVQGGYDIVFSPAHREARPLEDERPHRVLPREHVLADRDRERRVPAQADELPVPHHDLPLAHAQLSRAAVPLRGAGHRLPLRALGRAARPPARARLHPGRRAPLLPAGPARRRDRARARLRDHDPEARSASTATTSTSRPGPRSRAGTDEQWETATSALKKALGDARPAVHRRSRARASSTGPRSTSRSRTRSTAPGSARRSRSTSTTRTASSSSTSARTARRTSR